MTKVASPSLDQGWVEIPKSSGAIIRKGDYLPDIHSYAKGFIDSPVTQAGTRVFRELTNIKEGDRVALVYRGYNDAPRNPLWGGRFGKVLGTVTEIRESVEFIYRVQWDNGANNAYKEGDLNIRFEGSKPKAPAKSKASESATREIVRLRQKMAELNTAAADSAESLKIRTEAWLRQARTLGDMQKQQEKDAEMIRSLEAKLQNAEFQRDSVTRVLDQTRAALKTPRCHSIIDHAAKLVEQLTHEQKFNAVLITREGFTRPFCLPVHKYEGLPHRFVMPVLRPRRLLEIPPMDRFDPAYTEIEFYLQSGTDAFGRVIYRQS